MMDLFCNFLSIYIANIDAVSNTNSEPTNGFNWILMLAGSIAISITANLATDPFKNILSRLGRLNSKRRVKQIKKELKILLEYQSEPIKLISYSIEKLISILLFFGIAELILSLKDPVFDMFYRVFGYSTNSINIVKMGGPSLPLYYIWPFIIGVCYTKAVVNAQKILITFDRVRNYDRYRNRQQNIIDSLLQDNTDIDSQS